VTASFQTEKADKPVVSATLIFALALFTIAWDFVYLQRMVYDLSILAVNGLVLHVTGVVIRAAGERHD